MKFSLFVFMVMLLTFVSCNTVNKTDNNRPAEQDSFDLIVQRELSKKVNVDTVFLGFVLGASEKQTEDHVKKLLSSKKLYPKMKEKFLFENEPVEWEGYLYNFYSNDDFDIPCQINFDFFEDRLCKLTIYTTQIQFRDKIREFLIKVYGEPNYVNQFDYWIKGTREIELSKGYAMIQFSDIKIRNEQVEKELTNDSLDTEKKIIKEKESVQDFK